MKRLLNALTGAIADAVAPRGLICLCCDEYSEGQLLCPACAANLASLRLTPDQAGTEHQRGVFRYEGIAKRLVVQLKDSCVADAAFPLSQGMAEELRAMALPPDTVLTWVTMPQARLRQRGIDHGRTLCEAVAAQVHLPVQQLLVRTKNTHTQRGLSHDARLTNLSGSITCRTAVHGTVVLIDDVMTTGATGTLCARLLMAAGASDVRVLTATRAILRGRDPQKGES